MQNSFYISIFFGIFLCVSCSSRVSPNVLGLCDGGAIEAQIFNFAQKLNRRTTVELCSFAPLLQNPCACCTTQIYKKLV